jgi:hypothetical protein
MVAPRVSPLNYAQALGLEMCANSFGNAERVLFRNFGHKYDESITAIVTCTISFPGTASNRMGERDKNVIAYFMSESIID